VSRPPWVDAHPISFAAARMRQANRGLCMEVGRDDVMGVFIDAGFDRYPYVRIKLAPIPGGSAPKSRDARRLIQNRVLANHVLVRALGRSGDSAYDASVSYWSDDDSEWVDLATDVLVAQSGRKGSA
jgi:hypothetical protein